MKIFISKKEDGTIEAWATSRVTENDIEVEIDEKHPFLNDVPIYYKLINGEFIRDHDVVLERARKRKDKELNAACNLAILAGFTHEINGATYWFSYDMEAQGNFRDAKEALRDGLAPSIPWTVREDGENGPYTRIDIDYPTMQQLALVIMIHKTEKISRYRDELMPIVEKAALNEIDHIKW